MNKYLVKQLFKLLDWIKDNGVLKVSFDDCIVEVDISTITIIEKKNKMVSFSFVDAKFAHSAYILYEEKVKREKESTCGILEGLIRNYLEKVLPVPCSENPSVF